MSMEVKVFNVGQGSCAVVTYPGQPSLLVDAGSCQNPVNNKDVSIAQIASHINTHSHKGLSIILSHPNIDHYNWLPDILAKVNTDIPRNLTFGGNCSGYKNAGKILPYINAGIHDSSHLRQNTSHLPSYCSILHPGIMDSKNDNDQSIIVQAEDTNFRVILPGDAGAITLDHIPFPPQDTKKTYFVASHHGASNNGTNSWAALQKLKSTAIIISSGMHSGHQHPTAVSILNFINTTTSNHPEHALLAQTGTNIFGESNAPAIANYHGGFSLLRTSHPIYGTNNAGLLSITAAGVTPESFISTDNTTNVLYAMGRNYVSTFNFNAIKHLFLARMGITDTQIQQFHNLPNALSYFDLRNNKITPNGIVKLIALLHQRQNSASLVIKTTGNNECTIETIKSPVQRLAHPTSSAPAIKVLWNQPLAWIANGIDALHYNTINSAHTKKFPSQEETVRFLEYIKAARSSSSFYLDFSELFVHTHDKTIWYNYGQSNSFEFSLPNIIAALRAKNSYTFLFTDGLSSFIWDQDSNQQYSYKMLTGRMPHGLPQQLGSSAHIPTGFTTGSGLQEVDNLKGNNGHCCQFELTHPISEDGAAILTVNNQTQLYLWKKEDNHWIQKNIQTFDKPILYAGFNDLDRSVIIKFCDNTIENLTLALEALKS